MEQNSHLMESKKSGTIKTIEEREHFSACLDVKAQNKQLQDLLISMIRNTAKEKRRALDVLSMDKRPVPWTEKEMQDLISKTQCFFDSLFSPTLFNTQKTAEIFYMPINPFWGIRLLETQYERWVEWNESLFLVQFQEGGESLIPLKSRSKLWEWDIPLSQNPQQKDWFELVLALRTKKAELRWKCPSGSFVPLQHLDVTLNKCDALVKGLDIRAISTYQSLGGPRYWIGSQMYPKFHHAVFLTEKALVEVRGTDHKTVLSIPPTLPDTQGVTVRFRQTKSGNFDSFSSLVLLPKDFRHFQTAEFVKQPDGERFLLFVRKSREFYLVTADESQELLLSSRKPFSLIDLLGDSIKEILETDLDSLSVALDAEGIAVLIPDSRQGNFLCLRVDTETKAVDAKRTCRVPNRYKFPGRSSAFQSAVKFVWWRDVIVVDTGTCLMNTIAFHPTRFKAPPVVLNYVHSYKCCSFLLSADLESLVVRDLGTCTDLQWVEYDRIVDLLEINRNKREFLG